MFFEKWKELADKLVGTNTIDVGRFSELFTETWHYFIENSGIRRHDVEVIRYMSAIPVHEHSPENLSAGEFSALVKLTGTFLDALAFSDSEKGFDNVLDVELDDGMVFRFSLDNFSGDLAGLTEKCTK